MKHRLPCLICLVLLAAACSPNRDKEISAIEQLRLNLSPKEIISDDPDVENLLTHYRGFAANFPDDSLAPVYLRDAADMYISLGDPGQAVSLLDSVISLYPGFEDLGGCFFLKGLAFEAAEQFDSAKATYAYFVNNFPNHIQAPSTRIMLERNLVGATQEELINYLLEMASVENIGQ